MGTDGKVDEALREWSGWQLGHAWNARAACESPIEHLLLLALMTPRFLSKELAEHAPFPDGFPYEKQRGQERASVWMGSLAERIPGIAYGLGAVTPRPPSAGAVLVGGMDWYGLGPVLLWSQLSITTTSGKPYRADFAFVGPKTKLIVEADGHDFHERTKDQARRDKSRDRSLQAEGWKVLRFTGSEIYRDAAACAHEVAVCLSLENYIHMPPPEPDQ